MSHQIGPTIPWRRKSGNRKYGDDYPQYAEVVRWMKAYDGPPGFVTQMQKVFSLGDLSYKQVKTLHTIMKEQEKPSTNTPE